VFPPGPAHYHSTFYAWVDKVGVINKQTDFDGWVARVTQPQILDFIEFCYGLEITDAAGWDGKKYILPESELWATLNSNFLDIAVLEWCKLFTDAKAYHNWRKVVVDPNFFLPQLCHDFGASKKVWDNYCDEMRTYRDKFLAHLDNRTTMHIPPMDLAQFAIRYIYDTMRAEQIAVVFNNLPQNLMIYSEDCKAEAAELYARAVQQAGQSLPSPRPNESCKTGVKIRCKTMLSVVAIGCPDAHGLGKVSGPDCCGDD
jgi:hypothetical protein